MREGSDITLVGWGAQLSVMEQACLEAEKVNTSLFLAISDFVEWSYLIKALICLKFGIFFEGWHLL